MSLFNNLVKSRDLLAKKVDKTGLPNAFTKHKVCFDDVRPKTLIEFEASRHRELISTNTSGSCPKTTLKHPWQAWKQEANNNSVKPVYGVGQLHSTMNSMYFLVWSTDQQDITCQFVGKRSDTLCFDSNY